MNYNRFCLTIFVFLLMLCQSCTTTLISENWGKHLWYRDQLSRVIILFGEEIRAKRGWTLEDSTVKYNRETHKIKLLFKSMQVVDGLCEARKALVDTVETFLERLNTDSGAIADHGGEEFTYDDLDICINYITNYVQFTDPMCIGWVHMHDGVSYFYTGTFVAYDVDDTYWFKRAEYYYQSKVIVEAQEEGEKLWPRKSNKVEIPENSPLREDIFVG